MKTLFVLLFLCVGAWSLPFTPVNDERCNDPTYACQDLQTAAQCKVVKDCISDFWMTLGTPHVENEICDLCKEMVKEARDQLNSNETQEELKEVFEGSCNLIPIKPIAKICDNLVDQFIPELIEVLTSRMDPTQVCTISGLCAGSFDNVSIKKKVKSNPIVKMTEDVVAFIQRIPKIQMQRVMSHYCQNDLGLEPEVCEELMKDESSLLGLLTNQTPLPLGEADDMTCEFCKSLVIYLKNFIGSKTTEEEFKTGLLNLCTDMGSYKNECISLVDEYYETLYSFIINEMNPEEVCSALSLCTKTTKIEVRVIPNYIPVEDKYSLYKTNKVEANSIKCYACEQLVDHIRNKLNANSSHEEIKRELEVACDYLPLDYKNTCVGLVEQYGDQLIELLTGEMDSHAICVYLGYCESALASINAAELCSDCTTVYGTIISEMRTPDAERVTKLCSYVPEHMSEKCTNGDKFLVKLGHVLDAETACQTTKLCLSNSIGDSECTLCQTTMGEVLNFLKDPSSRAELKNLLESACSVFPGEIGIKCTKFVDEYSDLLINLLANELTPEMVCSLFGLCPAQVGDIQCQICQDFGHFLENELMDPKVQDQLIQVAEQVCVDFPGALRNDCIGFIDQYGRSLLTILAQQMDPTIICPAFCGNSPDRVTTTTTTVAPTTEVVPKPSSGEICTVCKYIVDNLDKLLEDDQIDQELTVLAEKVCNVLPEKTMAQCKTIVEAYAPYFLQMIGQMANSDQICQEFKLCTPPRGRVHLLGSKKCTFGPSYWCDTPQNAQSCKAEAYCKLKVW